MHIERRIMRREGDEWCELEVRLRNGRLSISSTYGEVIPRHKAEALAQEYWESYFEDNPAAIIEMNKTHGTQCYDAEGAAKYVLEVDGHLHGIDVHEEDGDEIYETQAVGQIIEELLRFFPEGEPYLQWHLNDMRLGCIHQEGVQVLGAVCEECGWSWGKGWYKVELPQEVIEWVQRLED